MCQFSNIDEFKNKNILFLCKLNQNVHTYNQLQIT
jgi:hypothetical protein